MGGDKIHIMFIEKLRLALEAGKSSPVTQTRIVDLFREIRDFPFDVTRPKKATGYEELVDNTRQQRRGGCSAKHYLLGWELQSLGIYPTFITLPFFWQDLEVDYPDQVRQLAEKMPIQYHLALAVISDDKVCLLDATWDRSLGKAGFPINTLDNSLTGIRLAIPPAGDPIFHHNGVDRYKFIETLKTTMSQTGLEPIFYLALNPWLNSLRNS